MILELESVPAGARLFAVPEVGWFPTLFFLSGEKVFLLLHHSFVGKVCCWLRERGEEGEEGKREKLPAI